MIGDWTVPQGWAWADLADVAQIEANLVSPADHVAEPHIAPNHIESGTGRLLPFATVGEDGVTSPKHLFRPGQVLYSKIRPYLAKAILSDFSGLCSADMYPIGADIEAGFLFRWLISPMFTRRASACQGRTVLPKINQKALNRTRLPVAPLPEQKRIVAKIDALQERSAAAKEALDAIPPLLKKFRQSVLAAAFRGDLTKQWRAENPDVEPASELLEGIRIERKQRWIEDAAEKSRAKAEAKAKKAGKPWGEVDDEAALVRERVKVEKKYKAPESVDASELPELPAGWAWARIDELSWFVTSGSRGWAKYYAESGSLFLRVGNLDHCRLELDLRSTVRVQPPGGAEGERTSVDPGDLLVSITADVGMVGHVPDGFGRAYINQHIALVRPVSGVDSRFLGYALLDPHGLQAIVREAQYGATKASLSLIQVRGFPVPLPPLAEQEELARQVDGLLGSSDRARNAHLQASETLSRIGPSLLAKAFRGELVRQDPNDEPASVLLERIRAERAAAKPKKKARKPRARR